MLIRLSLSLTLTHSEHFELVSLQATKLSSHFIGNTVILYHTFGAVKGNVTEGIQEGEKAKQIVGLKPTISWS